MNSLNESSFGGVPTQGPQLILHLLATGAGVGEAYDSYGFVNPICVSTCSIHPYTGHGIDSKYDDIQFVSIQL